MQSSLTPRHALQPTAAAAAVAAGDESILSAGGKHTRTRSMAQGSTSTSRTPARGGPLGLRPTSLSFDSNNPVTPCKPGPDLFKAAAIAVPKAVAPMQRLNPIESSPQPLPPTTQQAPEAAAAAQDDDSNAEQENNPALTNTLDESILDNSISVCKVDMSCTPARPSARFAAAATPLAASSSFLAAFQQTPARQPLQHQATPHNARRSTSLFSPRGLSHTTLAHTISSKQKQRDKHRKEELFSLAAGASSSAAAGPSSARKSMAYSRSLDSLPSETAAAVNDALAKHDAATESFSKVELSMKQIDDNLEALLKLQTDHSKTLHAYRRISGGHRASLSSLSSAGETASASSSDRSDTPATQAFLVKEIARLERELRDSEQQIASVKAQKESLAAERAAAEETLKQSNIARDQLHAELESRSTDAQSQLTLLRKDKDESDAVYVKRIAELAAQLNEASKDQSEALAAKVAELESLRVEHEALQASKAHLEESLNNRLAELECEKVSFIRKALEAKERATEKYNASRMELEERWAAKNAALLQEHETKLKEQENQVASLNTQLAQVESSKLLREAELLTEREACQIRVNELQQQLASLQERHTQIEEARVTECEAMIKQDHSVSEKLCKEMDALRTEQAKEVEALRERARAQEGELDRLNSELLATKQESMARIAALESERFQLQVGLRELEQAEISARAARAAQDQEHRQALDEMEALHSAQQVGFAMEVAQRDASFVALKKAALIQHAKDLSAAKEREQEQESKRQALEACIRELQAENQQIYAEREQSRVAEAAANMKWQELDSKLSTVEKLNESLAREVLSLESSVERVAARAAAMQKEMHDQISSLQTQLAELQSLHTARVGELEAASRKAALNENDARLEKKILETTISSLRIQLDAAKSSASAQSGSTAQEQAEQAQQTKADLAASESKVAELQERLAASESERAQIDASLLEAQRNLAELESSLSSLRESNATLQSEKDSLAAELSSVAAAATSAALEAESHRSRIVESEAASLHALLTANNNALSSMVQKLLECCSVDLRSDAMMKLTELERWKAKPEQVFEFMIHTMGMCYKWLQENGPVQRQSSAAEIEAATATAVAVARTTPLKRRSFGANGSPDKSSRGTPRRTPLQHRSPSTRSPHDRTTLLSPSKCKDGILHRGCGTMLPVSGQPSVCLQMGFSLKMINEETQQVMPATKWLDNIANVLQRNVLETLKDSVSP